MKYSQKICFSVLLLSVFALNSLAQQQNNFASKKWVDSVFNSLNDDQRIAQLMLLRVSSIGTNGTVFYDEKITEAINKFNIGGIVLFQGGPVQQANLINKYQALAKTPLMVCVDGEWGLGMRFDSIMPLNQQIMLGATNDAKITYEYGKLVAAQLKRAGIQVNFAPVVDINNNPNNPVINFRSFGEDKYRVALNGVQYMRGMQENGIMASAKHFPGHGDVSVDSHLDLPIINKTRGQLDSLELYPFREMIKEGVGSMMIAHLYVPSIDSTLNTATSLSKKNVTDLLKNELGFKGLIFTDALEMKGVTKFFPGGTISVQSLIAGNDMLCLPENVDTSIALIKQAIQSNQLSMDSIYATCKKILAIKYKYGLSHPTLINTNHLASDLNLGIPEMRKKVADNAITLLSNADKKYFPLSKGTKRVAYIGIGISADNAFSKRIKKDFNADVFFLDYKQTKDSLSKLSQFLNSSYDAVIVGIHNFKNYPSNNFGISETAISFVNQLNNKQPIIFVFGNPYAVKYFCGAGNIVACYDDNDVTQQSALDYLEGKFLAKGSLPVTVCDRFQYGAGIHELNLLPDLNNDISNHYSFGKVDSIMNDAIQQQATPGGVIMALKDGKIVFEKAYGTFNYDKKDVVKVSSLFDLASMTKICATTLSVMKLYGEKKLSLSNTVGDFLPWAKGSDKGTITIEDLLLHQGRLVPDINFEKRFKGLLSPQADDEHHLRVADNLYNSDNWPTRFNELIRESKLNAEVKYVYSDISMILMGEIVEAITHQKLNDYVLKEFYEPMGLSSTGFKPLERFPKNNIAPTEIDHEYRNQQMQGDVHDPTSAFLGGVAGHAGLFSNAYDIGVITQMLLNGGIINGRRYLDSNVIQLFTSYHSPISRRGLGFDKPEKDNAERKEPYPSHLASPLAFGHTGYTGTAFWVDPKYNIIYIFLSNRVNPNDSNKLGKMNVRPNVHDAIYEALGIHNN